VALTPFSAVSVSLELDESDDEVDESVLVDEESEDPQALRESASAALTTVAPRAERK
jgi:hypothetical protein